MTDINQYQPHIENCTNSSPLFKVLDKSSNQEVYFHNPHEAYEWMCSHKHWILKKHEVQFNSHAPYPSHIIDYLSNG